MKTKARKYLQDFANKHKVVFEDHGSVGFDRPCVGLSHGDTYIAHNPYNSKDYEPIEELADENLYPPDEVPNAYHKFDCLAVLVHSEDYDGAIIELYKWIKHLETLGEIQIVEYNTGATGMQAMFTGVFKKAVKIKYA